jgi:hypothetical protein
LVVPNSEGNVTILLENCGDVDVKIPSCTAVGFLKSKQNRTFKEIYMVGEDKLKKEVSQDKPTPKSMSNEDKLKKSI